jgi:hypothetical protein
VNNLAADPLIKPNQIADGASWTRTMGWTEHKQVRYATARSTFRWDGTDSVKSATKRRFACWMKRSPPTSHLAQPFWVDEEGQSASPYSIWCRILPGETTLIKAAKS